MATHLCMPSGNCIRMCASLIFRPYLNGIEAAIKLRECESDPRIVFLTINEDSDLVRAALRTGALGYVAKSRMATICARPILREPLSLSRVLRRLAETLPYKSDHSFRSQATKQDVRTFIAERRQSDLLFLRLPSPAEPLPAPKTYVSWREEWSKRQYLGFVEDLLHTGAHTPAWAIAHTESGLFPAMSWLKLWDVCESFRRLYERLSRPPGRARLNHHRYWLDFIKALATNTACSRHTC
jgi:hypothetical protein